MSEPNQATVQLVQRAYDDYVKWALEDGPLFKPLTDEEREERRQRRLEEVKPRIERWARVKANTGGVLRQVVSLHEPSQGLYDDSCSGCAATVSGYDYECQPWPCATFLTIERSL